MTTWAGSISAGWVRAGGVVPWAVRSVLWWAAGSVWARGAGAGWVRIGHVMPWVVRSVLWWAAGSLWAWEGVGCGHGGGIVDRLRGRSLVVMLGGGVVDRVSVRSVGGVVVWVRRVLRVACWHVWLSGCGVLRVLVMSGGGGCVLWILPWCGGSCGVLWMLPCCGGGRGMLWIFI